MASNPRTPAGTNLSNDRITAFFRNKEDAFRAISELKRSGFTEDQIGLATRDDDSVANTSGSADHSASTRESGSHDKGFWQEVKDFFTGNDADDDLSTRDDYSVQDFGYDENRSNYYDQGIRGGGAIVTVTGARVIEARPILERHNADLRESGFDQYQSTTDTTRNIGQQTSAVSPGRGVTKGTENLEADRDYRLQLRGEILRAHKERVQRGEVRLRKEVITENQTIEVPVTREELVIERTPGSGEVANAGDFGTDREIRVPLSEERVRTEKRPVVSEEVRVGKRQVQDTHRVQDEVRHEELRVDKDGDVQVEGENIQGKPGRKKPAA